MLFSDDEIAALRHATAGVDHVVHLNHAGSSLPSRAVVDAQIAHLRREEQIGGYEAAAERADDDRAVYASLARLVGGQSHEIARFEHATAAWNAAFWSIPMKPGQRILTASAAYGANAVGFLRAAERRDVSVEVIPDDEHGQIDVAALADRIDDDVALVALTHIPTNGGLVNPAAEVGAVANAAGVPYLLDACQSVGQRVVDVAEIGCDLLSATGRKFLRGPRGTGFLWASERIIERLVPDHPDHHGADWTSVDEYRLRADARRYEHWEYAHAGWLAFGVAVDEANGLGLARIQATVENRADMLRTRLAETGFEIADLGAVRSGIVTVHTPGFDAFEVRDRLRAKAINISVSTPASTRYDSSRRDLGDVLRLSVHYLTTADEIDRAMSALAH